SATVTGEAVTGDAQDGDAQDNKKITSAATVTGEAVTEDAQDGDAQDNKKITSAATVTTKDTTSSTHRASTAGESIDTVGSVAAGIKCFFWSPKSSFSFDFRCPGCGRNLQSKGLHQAPKSVETSRGKAGRDMRASDPRLLSQLPLYLRECFPFVESYTSGAERVLLDLLLDRQGSALTFAGLTRQVETFQRAAYDHRELAYLSACRRHQSLSGE
ncbi:hypothetical protein FOL47_002173, partial [Perkinsus chesapeaki]